MRAWRIVSRVVAVFYGYGALVHVLNMLSLTGFDWPAAPLRWQVRHVACVRLDLLVAVGLWRGWSAGVAAFYVAASSQVVLYTVLREWILDVPPEFTVSAEQRDYLSGLVVFHLVTLVAVSAALWVRHQRLAPGVRTD